MTHPGAEVRSIQDFIRKLPLFADLPADDISRLCRSSRRVSVPAGDVVMREGTPGDALYIIISGELEVTKREGDGEMVLAVRKSGEFLGEMSLLESAPRSASARAVVDSRLLVIEPDDFQAVLESSPSAAKTILRTIAARLRSTEASLMSREKLASLGTLAAGLAHELNNPASAIQRSSGYLSEAFTNWRRWTSELNSMQVDAAQKARLTELDRSVVECNVRRVDVSGLDETELESWLESVGVTEPWDLAPPLAAYGWTRESLEPLVALFGEEKGNVVVHWLGTGLAAQELIEEIRRSAGAISDIVRSVKTYAYLDQAPIQEVDVRASLEDTLVMLRHKWKHGVEVRREFDAELPRIEAYASELNQVWTNLIDNAIQAMDGKGVLELHVRRVGDEVEVLIVDDGPGIPDEIRPRIFDVFFTTKAPGVGTGLGLHIVHNIVVNHHRGRIDVASQPGRTTFRVVLPLRLKKEVRSEK